MELLPLKFILKSPLTLPPLETVELSYLAILKADISGSNSKFEEKSSTLYIKAQEIEKNLTMNILTDVTILQLPLQLDLLIRLGMFGRLNLLSTNIRRYPRRERP